MKNLKIYEKALIVVDMVNGFVREGALADRHIKNTISNQLELVDKYMKENELVIFIKDTHTKDSVEHHRFGGVLHCLEGTDECELVDELKPYEYQENTISLKKNSTSFVFAKTEDGKNSFIDIISDACNVKNIDVVGCCTDICIANGVLPMMNYFDEINRLVNVNIYPDMIDTYEIPGVHERKKYEDAAYLLMVQQGSQIVKKLGGKR